MSKWMLHPSNGAKKLFTDAKAALLIAAGWTETTAPPGEIPVDPTPQNLTAEDVRDVIGAALRAGTNVQIVVDDNGDTITISATGGGGGAAYTDEQVRDVIGAALRGAGGATVEVDDAGDTITIRSKNRLADLTDVAVSGAAVGGLYALEVLGTNPTTFKLTAVTGGSGGTAVTVDGSAVSTLAIDSTPVGISDISGLASALASKLATADAAETAQDAIAALLAAGTHTGITFTYNDASNSLSAAVTGSGGSYTDEQAQDAIAALIAAGTHSGISFTYDDANNRLSATVTAAGGGGTHPDDVLAAGEGTCSRRNTIVQGGTTTSGVLYLSFFTATRSEDVTQVRTFTSAAAAATPTLCRVGVYREDPSTRDLALVASIPSDTALWAAANTAFSRALSAALSKIAGARYAVGVLVVSAAAPPQFYGRQIPNSAFNATIEATTPRLVGQLTGQTDLPASIAATAISNGSPRHVYAELVP